MQRRHVRHFLICENAYRPNRDNAIRPLRRRRTPTAAEVDWECNDEIETVATVHEWPKLVPTLAISGDDQ